MKVRCNEYGCYWKGQASEVLKAPNPFDPEDTLEGCPDCHEPNTIVSVCDEPDCWRMVSCGAPTKSVYRNTCGKHQPEG